MSYVKGSQLPSTSTVADTDTLIVTQEGDSKATKKVAKSDLLKEDRTRLTNLQQENQTLKNNVKALEYVINNSNRLNYTGEIITNSNSAVGDIRNIIVNGNTRYKKSDGTYTDTWEDGVTLESVGETEKNSDGKYPIVIKSSNDTKENKRTILLENPLRKTPQITDVLDLDKKQVTRNCGVLTINGSEDWVSNNKFFYTSSNYFNKLEQTRGNKCISNYNYVDYKDLDDQTKYGVTIAQNYRICLENMNPSNHSVEELKTWLANNPVTIVYALATPTTERIEILPTDNPLQSYTPSTTLTTNNIVKGNISADIPTNVNAIIVNQANSIKTLTDSLLETQALLIDNAIDNA